MIHVAGYSLATFWILIIGAATADHYGIRSGPVAVGAFLLGVLFLFAVLKTAPEEDWL